MKKEYFKYTDEDLTNLMEKDEKLKEYILSRGKIEREINPDLFLALIESIIAQQISKKAASTVTNRFYHMLGGDYRSSNIDTFSEESIKSCGMTLKKAKYIKEICRKVLEGELDFHHLSQLDNEEFIKTLSLLNGVGVWTAEMMLIFSLNRMDVLSYGDLAIRRGIMKLHSLETLSKKEFLVYKKLYSPYASIASLYLWELSAI